jgi:hypothetical protein
MYDYELPLLFDEIHLHKQCTDSYDNIFISKTISDDNNIQIGNTIAVGNTKFFIVQKCRPHTLALQLLGNISTYTKNGNTILVKIRNIMDAKMDSNYYNISFTIIELSEIKVWT